jgi:phosphoribosylamine--glycine ligase
MNLLLLGSGGREHALARKISESNLCSQLYIAPGNAGTAQCGINVNLDISDFKSLCGFCTEARIDMVIVGPEDPLVNGIVDYFEAEPELRQIPVIGPNQTAAQLEGSKAFSKKFMERHGIPTAAFRKFSSENFEEGIEYLMTLPLPIVIKADGLAAGKGVIIAQSHVEAVSEFELMIQQAKFGEASQRVVVEEFLTGIELSIFVLTDGKNYVLLPEAKDYKRIGIGDTGLNTGGMGAVSPVPFADTAFMQQVEEKIIKPTIAGLQSEGIVYKGFIFVGLMKVGDAPYVIEYNCRMGDPETEVVLPRMQSDIVELFVATAEGKLEGMQIDTDPRTAVTMICSSRGYPGAYEKGYLISGLEAAQTPDTIVFHAGTLTAADNTILTNGGRVLAVTSFGQSVQDAAEKSKTALAKIDFDGMYYRKDIGYEFID